MKRSQCPFCHKTVKDYFLESSHFASIYNISPILPGHSLIISKTHKNSLFELTEKELSEFMSLGRQTAKLLSHVFNTDAFDWAVQEKEAAGQSIAHLHMHVVPRKIGDLPNPGDWYQALEKRNVDCIDTYQRFRLSEEQLMEVTKNLRTTAKTYF